MKNEILIQVEDYAKKLHAVDYWSGEVKSSAILAPAYEATANLQKIFGTDKDVWVIINDYAKKLHSVDYWSGEVKSSAVLKPAYDARDKLEQIIMKLDISPRKKM
jgi:hypothetical protein